MKLTNQVRIYRQQQKWTQEQFAERIGVTRQTVISLEKGRYDPSLPLAFKLSAVFGCKIEDLFIPGED